VDRYLRWRSAAPGRWLVAACLAVLGSYLTDARSSVVPWLLFDLWLAYRIWHGGLLALTTYRVLQTMAACLFGGVLVLNLVSPGVFTGPGPETGLLFAASAWCLMARALQGHVDARHRRLSIESYRENRLLGS
jgi:hypothetical protein